MLFLQLSGSDLFQGVAEGPCGDRKSAEELLLYTTYMDLGSFKAYMTYL